MIEPLLFLVVSFLSMVSLNGLEDIFHNCFRMIRLLGKLLLFNVASAIAWEWTASYVMSHETGRIVICFPLNGRQSPSCSNAASTTWGPPRHSETTHSQRSNTPRHHTHQTTSAPHSQSLALMMSVATFLPCVLNKCAVCHLSSGVHGNFSSWMSWMLHFSMIF